MAKKSKKEKVFLRIHCTLSIVFIIMVILFRQFDWKFFLVYSATIVLNGGIYAFGLIFLDRLKSIYFKKELHEEEK